MFGILNRPEKYLPLYYVYYGYVLLALTGYSNYHIDKYLFELIFNILAPKVSKNQQSNIIKVKKGKKTLIRQNRPMTEELWTKEQRATYEAQNKINNGENIELGDYTISFELSIPERMQKYLDTLPHPFNMIREKHNFMRLLLSQS